MRELFSYLVVNKISPNGLFTLHTLHNKYSFDNYINISTELYRLSLSGHVKKDVSSGEYVITSLGLEVLNQSEKLVSSIKKTTKKKLNISFEEWQENILAYNTLFPKGKKEGTHISYRTSPKELYDRFIWFFAEYPEYTWELVLQATKSYVEAFETSGDYTYMQTSKYFIKKEDKLKTISSTLASVCYNIQEGNDEDISKLGTYYFGP